MLSKVLRRVAKVGLGATGVAVAGSAAGTAYVYKTDESMKRCIDFHILITPMCWDYSMAFYKTSPDTQARKDTLEQLHKRYAPETLANVLKLGGYYVKCGQMFCGMGFLPDAWEEHFSVLLDGVPAKPFEVVRGIVEDELGGPISKHFAQFDERALAAASIGQVHCASLHDGTEVVVKVQYPEVERFFRLDFLSIKTLCQLCTKCGMDIGVDEKSLDKIFGECTKSFEEEFDYRLEAKNMSLVASNLSPTFGTRVHVPLPVEDKCTKKVLTMEKIQGEPIKKRMGRFMEEMAAGQGKTKEQLENELKAQFSDPAELQKLLSKPPPSAFQIKTYQAFLRIRDGFRNIPAFAHNMFASLVGMPYATYKWTTLPLDAVSITKLLFDVHAHQLFVDGAFNADPHAGNVMICDDGRLGLIDFGNVQKVPCLERRKALSRFYLALAKDCTDRKETWNEAEIAATFQALGATSVKSDVTFLAINAILFYDMRVDPDTMKRFGMKPDWSDSMNVLGSDEFDHWPADLINLQRLCQTLVGVAGAIGAGQPSCAKMWQATCMRVSAS